MIPRMHHKFIHRPIHRVLLAVDFTEEESSAEQMAIDVCRNEWATLTLVHVISALDSLPNEVLNTGMHFMSRVVDDLNNQLIMKASYIRNQYDLVVNHVVCIGSPVPELTKIASQRKMDLMILCPDALPSGLTNRKLPASGYDVVQLVDHAPCPVFAVPSVFSLMDFREIWIPFTAETSALEHVTYFLTTSRFLTKGTANLLVRLCAVLPDTDKDQESLYLKQVDLARSVVAKKGIYCSSNLYSERNLGNLLIDIERGERPALIICISDKQLPARLFANKGCAVLYITPQRMNEGTFNPDFRITKKPTITYTL